MAIRLPSLVSAAYWLSMQRAQLRVAPWSQLAVEPPFNNASLAIVGNAGYLSDLEQGTAIDNHDLVLRMNNFAVEGHEAHVGRRMDLFLTTFHNDVQLDRPLLRDARYVVSSVPNNFRKGTLRYRHGEFITRGARKLGRRELFAPTLAEFMRLHESLGMYPTSGAMAVYLVLEHLLPVCSRVYFTGFSFFSGRSHYYSERQVTPRNHDPQRERVQVAEQLAPHWRSGQVTVDPVMADYLGLKNHEVPHDAGQDALRGIPRQDPLQKSGGQFLSCG